ncbi:redoxin domain-containing protein [Bosea sp. TAB14]|uniref:redoxin domain-containing protein n=1 Tax=Bosea sp. TAB14 TaxID=3237481 RepID=UPI003F8DAC69
MVLQEGEAAPDFRLPRDGGGEVTLAGFRGRKLVLYAYPKDDTTGCTRRFPRYRVCMHSLTQPRPSRSAGSSSTRPTPSAVRRCSWVWAGSR